ncbi:MAG: cation-translocating P-type ATPase [Planctomycetota bacterium JB042]
MTDTTASAPWSVPPDDLLRSLGSSLANGLDEGEARRRLAVHGPNQLRRTPPRSSWRILAEQFANLIVVLLTAAAVAAFAFGETVEGSAIVAVLFLNAAIGFVTERRAVRSMEALRELGQAEATVRRGGEVTRIAARDLVPGDVVILDAGDVLTADVRLVAGSRLQADESALTGESLPVDKDPAPVPAETALAERTPMLFKGTAVTRGAAEAVVTATGMETELGRISALVASAEPEATPLERRLDRLARKLIGLTLVIAALVAAAVRTSGHGPLFAVEIGIALAVATIPEGLPIVATLALARGMFRMARKNALIEQMAAVETLGSTTVILTDKTGTLTENRMTLVELALADGAVRVEGTGLETEGRFLRGDAPVDPSDDALLLDALRVGVLCNNATIAPDPAGGEARAHGDPTEVALIVAGAKAGLDRAALVREAAERRELAFDPDTKRMATIHAGPDGPFAAVKGAPETVVDACGAVRTGDGDRPLGDAERTEWLARAERLAARGERVLALATAYVAPGSEEEFDYEELVLLGLVGLLDPPRDRVREAIDACQSAGIRVVMVTGDHGATAWTVAAAVGLIDPAPDDPMSFVDARGLADLSRLDGGARERLLAAPVIARASPEQKLDLIEMHQRAGAIVAMTGDGVNDAPALKKADIGVAMGRRGTQVAREAADMVLRDDEFGTIVVAVRHGRAIFANIRKFVVYLMTCNVSEILAIGLGALTPGPLPILPLQILFLNLVTDVFPALALGVGEGSPALMDDPPRDPKEPILTRRHWRAVFLQGGVMAGAVLGALATAKFGLDRPDDEATTIAFLTLALAQLWYVFNMRNRSSAWLANEVTRNPWVWGALALCVGLLVLAVEWAPLATVLSIVDPGAAGWGLALGASLVPLAVGQATMAFTPARRARRGPAARSAAPPP